MRGAAHGKRTGRENRRRTDAILRCGICGKYNGDCLDLFRMIGRRTMETLALVLRPRAASEEGASKAPLAFPPFSLPRQLMVGESGSAYRPPSPGEEPDWPGQPEGARASAREPLSEHFGGEVVASCISTTDSVALLRCVVVDGPVGHTSVHCDSLDRGPPGGPRGPCLGVLRVCAFVFTAAAGSKGSTQYLVLYAAPCRRALY